MYLIILAASVVVVVTIVRNLSRGAGRQSASDDGPIYAGYPVNDSPSYREPSKIDRDAFYLNLQKTIHWTEKIVGNIKDVSAIDYSRVLRTTNLLYNNRPFYSWDFDTTWVSPTEGGNFDYFKVLSLAMEHRTDTELIESAVEKGKILAFEIDITTCDGAPIEVSEGFVDDFDIPPIDTWFFVTKKYLYCWIPTLFIGKMQDAINVEILGSYQWLEDTAPNLNSQILDRVKK